MIQLVTYRQIITEVASQRSKILVVTRHINITVERVHSVWYKLSLLTGMYDSKTMYWFVNWRSWTCTHNLQQPCDWEPACSWTAQEEVCKVTFSVFTGRIGPAEWKQATTGPFWQEIIGDSGFMMHSCDCRKRCPLMQFCRSAGGRGAECRFSCLLWGHHESNYAFTQTHQHVTKQNEEKTA